MARSKLLATAFLFGFFLWLPGAVLHAHDPQPPPEEEDLLTSLIETPEATPGFVFISMLIAGVFGAMHALSPGHGKTVVAAYLIGTRSTAKHAVFLGFIVTLTHTIGVFLLGVATFFASRYILPEQLYPWLSAASGSIVFIIGTVMFVMRMRSVFSRAHRDRTHGAPQVHDADHHHVDDHHHDDLPDGHHHHHHQHPDGGHHAAHAWDAHHDHKHGHSHMPPGMDGSPVTWKSLLALGVSGGILPCPSALVLLLAAISLHRVGLGLVLILAFSAGLAVVLTCIGLLFVKARRLLEKLPLGSPLMTLLPIATALVIMVLGVGIMVKALPQIMQQGLY